MKTIGNIRRYLQLFFFGGFVYGLIEIFWRGYTHWSMVLTGGAVLLLLLTVSRAMKGVPLLITVLIDSFVITLIELTVGCVFNLWLNLNVWDYSTRPFHFLGQICPLYSFYWFILCIPIHFLCRWIDRSHFTPAVERSHR